MIRKIRQKLNGLFDNEEDRGVSPVIGVILMVAITVILAAVIGAFVLGLGDDLDSSASPTATVDISGIAEETDESGNVVTEDAITIEHTRGDNLDTSELRVVFRDADGQNIGFIDDIDVVHGSDEIMVGDTITLNDDHANIDTTGGINSAELVHQPSGTQIGSGDVSDAGYGYASA